MRHSHAAEVVAVVFLALATGTVAAQQGSVDDRLTRARDASG